MGLEDTQFYQAAVVPTDPAVTIGKRPRSIVERGGLSALTSLLRGNRGGREYLLRDAQIETYLGFVEDVSNIVNEELLSDPRCAELAEKIRTSIDHGYNHFRRVEKYKKAIDKEGHELRGNDNYLFFELSSYMAVRFHDLIEVQTQVKEGHDAAAALFSYGYLTEIGEKVIGLLWGEGHRLPEDPELRKEWEAQALEEWNKIASGTAFISLHHSKPENMPSIDVLAQDGVFDPQKVLEKVEAVAKENGQTLTEFFPPYEMITKTIEQIKRGEIRPLKLTKPELKGLVLQSRVVSAADKLDGTYPATLAATRSILTVPDREFYTRMDKPLHLEEELDSRIHDGSGHMSQCDFNRILFELTRTSSFTGINNTVSYLFRRGLEDRARYFQAAIPAFLSGDFGPYLDGYEQHERESIQSLLVKTGVSRDQARLILNFEDHQNRHKDIRALLEQQGFHGNMLDDLILHIHLERDQVETALQGKYEKLGFLGLADAEKQRIETLLRMAIAKQKSTLPRNIGPIKMPSIYDGYYWIDIEKWRINEKDKEK